MASAQTPESKPSKRARAMHGAPPAFEWHAGTVERRGRLRLRTLVLLRWLAAAGQTSAVLITALFLHFQIPLGACLAVIAASVALNVVLVFMLPGRHLAQDWEAAARLLPGADAGFSRRAGRHAERDRGPALSGAGGAERRRLRRRARAGAGLR